MLCLEPGQACRRKYLLPLPVRPADGRLTPEAHFRFLFATSSTLSVPCISRQPERCCALLWKKPRASLSYDSETESKVSLIVAFNLPRSQACPSIPAINPRSGYAYKKSMHNGKLLRNRFCVLSEPKIFLLGACSGLFCHSKHRLTKQSTKRLLNVALGSYKARWFKYPQYRENYFVARARRVRALVEKLSREGRCARFTPATFSI